MTKQAMKKILVPFDFSKTAINAFRFALDITSQSKGTVHLLHVIELPFINDPIVMPVITFEQGFFKDLREKADKEFDKIISKYNLDGKVKTTVEFGPIAKMITEFATKQSMDLIVMGSHGASGLREVFVGSNAEKVVRNSSIPVLVIKNYYKGPIKNIIFPNTLELDNMQDFTMKVKALQAFFKAKLHIVYINTPTNFTPDTITLQRLKEFAKRFMFRDFTINIFNHQFEEDGILDFAKSMNGDLTAIGTHGRKGISHLINGSLAENVVNHTQSSIWTYNLKLESALV
jgi:nucleotide-binding universal stress UspA family protein